MKTYLLSLSLTLIQLFACGQRESFDEMLKKMYSGSISLLQPSELKKELASEEKILILDAREAEEYNTSHINNAKLLGYKKIDVSVLNGVDKDTKVVVYCSVGYRSEKIGEKLQKLGYTNVYNLYGGIFQWKNKGNTVVDNEEKETEEVHTYSKKWSKWLTNGKKVY